MTMARLTSSRPLLCRPDEQREEDTRETARHTDRQTEGVAAIAAASAAGRISTSGAMHPHLTVKCLAHQAFLAPTALETVAGSLAMCESRDHFNIHIPIYRDTCRYVNACIYVSI